MLSESEAWSSMKWCNAMELFDWKVLWKEHLLLVANLALCCMFGLYTLYKMYQYSQELFRQNSLAAHHHLLFWHRNTIKFRWLKSLCHKSAKGTLSSCILWWFIWQNLSRSWKENEEYAIMGALSPPSCTVPANDSCVVCSPILGPISQMDSSENVVILCNCVLHLPKRKARVDSLHYIHLHSMSKTVWRYLHFILISTYLLAFFPKHPAGNWWYIWFGDVGNHIFLLDAHFSLFYTYLNMVSKCTINLLVLKNVVKTIT